MSESTSYTIFDNFKPIGGLWRNQATCLIHNVAFLPTTDHLYLFGGTGNNDLKFRKKFKFCDGHAVGDITMMNNTHTVIRANPIDTDALPSVVRVFNQYYVYTRLNIDKHMSGKRGVRLYKLTSLDDIQETHIKIELPFYSYTQNIVYHGGKFHGFFCSYDGLQHSPYNNIKIAYATSTDGILFSVVNRNLFPQELVYVVNGFIRDEEKTLVFFKNMKTETVFYITL